MKKYRRAMNLEGKIFYLHYILSFLNNEYKICHSLDETHLKELVLSYNSNICHNLQENCYQLIYEPHYCSIRLLKNENQQQIEKKLWMKQYLQDSYGKIIDYREIEKNNSKFYKRKVSYVKEIEIEMKLDLFNKIVQNLISDLKNFTSQDIFFICYSYGFLHLDEKFIILRNILSLITHEKFNFNIIHSEFIQYVTPKYFDSPYYKKLIEKISSNDDHDLQSEIFQFISRNQHKISNDDFLKELLQWRLKITNFIDFIQQSFCFQISTDEGDLVAKISHNLNSRELFDITIKNIDSIMFLLSNDCIMTYVSFSNCAKSLLTSLLDVKPNIKYNITDFFIELYKYDEQELIVENMKFCNFMTFLREKIATSIIFIIKKIQLIVKYKNNGNVFTISKKYMNELFQFDELLLVSKKIVVLRVYLVNNPLLEIAEMIIKEFVNRKKSKIQDISILKYEPSKRVEKNQKIQQTSILHRRTDKMKKKKKHDKNPIETMSYCGSKQVGSSFIGLHGVHQKYADYNFIVGFYENKFSLLGLEPNYSDVNLRELSDFVHQISNSLQTYPDYESMNFNHHFDSMYIQNNDSNILIFHVDFHCHNSNPLEFHLLNDNNIAKLNINQYDDKNLEKQRNSTKSHNGNHLKIYHKIKSLNYKNVPRIDSSLKLPPSINNYENLIYEFQIVKSNFHVIISQVIEVISMLRRTSVLKKLYRESKSELQIQNCNITFLRSDFASFNHITLLDCKAKQRSYLCINPQDHSELNIELQNYEHDRPVLIDQFISIQQNTTVNYFNFVKKKSEFSLTLQNSCVNIIGKIPENLNCLSLSKCKIISVKNNVLLSSSRLSEITTTEDNFSKSYDQIRQKLIHNVDKPILKFYDSCLPHNLSIIGTYSEIEITKCISSFVIDSLCSLICIKNHKNEFSIANILSKAIPKHSKNLFLFKTDQVRMENLEIDRFENVHTESINIINCTIKNLSNVYCKFINIQNTRCPLRFLNAKNNFCCVFGPFNIFKSKKKYEIIDNFLHSDE